MQIHISKDEDVLVVSVDGRIDTLSAQEFQRNVEEQLERGETNIVLNFEKLEYVSSAGLRSVLVAAKKAKAMGGIVRCCSLQPMVKKVFEISGFAAIIPVFGTLDQALG